MQTRKGAVTVVIQARMGSNRLPGKVLKLAAGKTMLAILVERLRRAETIDQIILATSVAPGDGLIVDEAERLGLPTFLGSEHDVLSRYAGAARKYDLPAVVRITADCPLTDPAVVDFTVGRFLSERPDYCTNALDRSVPKGLDVEVMSRAALERADAEATDNADREHVTRFFYTHPERFRVLHAAPHDATLAGHRWTLDTPADYRFLTTILDHFHIEKPGFDMNDVLTFLATRPELEVELRRGLESAS